MGSLTIRAALARLLDRPLRTMIRRRRRINALFWDVQYALGMWNYLDRPGDDTPTELIHRYVPRPSILDLGCGTTVNLPLRPGGYRHYHGVDISRTAIGRARSLRRPDTSFEVADVLGYHPTRPYDVVLLREVLYYFSPDQAVDLVRRVARSLAPGGVVIIWLYDVTTDTGAELARRVRDCGLLVREETARVRDGVAAGATFVLSPVPSHAGDR